MNSREAHPSVIRIWAAFLSSDVPAAREALHARFSVWAFGHGPAMADELLSLVLAGKKRATAGALWSYEAEDEPIPRAGDFSVVTDGRGKARCILRTTSVEIVAFDEVDESFARAEGEGDCSLEYWRAGHWRFFQVDLAEIGRQPHASMPVVCERFEVVYTL